MSTRRNEPRIPPLSADELDDETMALLPKIMVAGSFTTGRSNVMTTLVRHPTLFQPWTSLLDALLNGRLPDRDREILVLRTAWNCRSGYAWGQHVVVGRKVGLTGEEIQRTRDGADAPGWSDADALLLRVADELHADYCVSDATWADLAKRYDEQQLIELLVVVGHYQMLAMVVNALGVPRDAGLPELEDELGVAE